MFRPLFFLAATLLFTICGCACNPSGYLAASKTGDLSNPPAPRVKADAQLALQCGRGELLGAGVSSIARKPYLQRTTDRSTRIVWTTRSSAPAHVEITTPEGSIVTLAPGEEDTSARPAGARQIEANITGLEPGTLYCYVIKEGDTPVARRAGFRTAPAAGGAEPVRFVAWGDSGTGNDEQRAIRDQLVTVPFDFILHMGDIAYEEGTLQQFEETFFGVYSGLLRHFPVFPVAGNHDYATFQAAPFREVFHLPENGSTAGQEQWYSFDWGNVHFVGLDTERVNSDQVSWLKADLAKNEQPWTIAFLHKPPFSSGEHGSDEAVRSAFGPIFEEHKVALVLAGHEHNYERMKPQRGVHYIVTGGGGRETRSVGTSDFTAFSDEVFHFLYVDVTGDKLALHTIDGTGMEFDSLVIDRGAIQ